MKMLVVFAFAMVSVSAYAKHTLHLTCLPKDKTVLGAPTYMVVTFNDLANRTSELKLVKANASARSYSVSIESASMVRYGNTTIVTLDQGKSGYAHIYASGEIAVIDINLFRQAEMNTNGPVTNYVCK